MGGGQAGYILSDIAMPSRKFLLFTVHAETALAERRLHRSVVELAARYPDWTRPDPNDPLLEHRFRQIPDYCVRGYPGGMSGRCSRNPYSHRIPGSTGKETLMTPKVQYDASANAAFIRFSDDSIVESEEVAPGVVFDFDEAGHLVAIELLDARAKLPPAVLEEAA